MPLKTRIVHIAPIDYNQTDPQLDVQAVVYDAATGLVVRDFTLTYSGDVIAKLADAAAVTRIRDDVLAEAFDTESSVTAQTARHLSKVARFASLLNTALDIPATRPKSSRDSTGVARVR